MDYKKKIEAFIEEEKGAKGSAIARERYLEVHKKRFAFTLDLCTNIVSSKQANVLDIGRSEFTLMLADYYEQVTTLGFPLEADDGGHREKDTSGQLGHIVFDLNDSRHPHKWPEVHEQFDLIVYAETIEHIHTAPEYSLLMLHSLLSETGRLVITTPNAGAFYKRIRLLLGMNPFEKIRFFDENPGHFREYTMAELKEMCKQTGYKVDEAMFKKFSSVNPFSSLKALKYLPIKPLEFIPVFKNTLIMVASKG